MTGLTPETPYHYRLVAGNANGFAKSHPDRIYLPRAVSAVDTGTATNILGATATLRGSFQPEEVPTTYSFEYGTTTAYGSTSAASASWRKARASASVARASRARTSVRLRSSPVT